MTDELHVVEWLTITGRGLLAVIDTPHPDPSLLKNEVVYLERNPYLVIGIEWFYPRKPEDPYGLLVRRLDD